MSISETILFIVADETHNAGERDYMLALAADINGHMKKNTHYLVYKIAGVDGAKGADTLAPYFISLPQEPEDYAAIPRLNLAALKNVTGTVHIVSVGQHTLNAATETKEMLEAAGCSVRLSYITHCVEEFELEKIIAHNATVYCQGDVPKGVHQIRTETVPHTNTTASCEIHYKRFIKSEHGGNVRSLLETGEKFAIAVVNAGFDIENKYVPYLKTEAEIHGYALGSYFTEEIQLLLLDGGPRNRSDRNCGQDTMPAFTNAYQRAQNQQGAKPDIIAEPFRDDADYNAIKMAYILSRNEHCVAFISNAESYGTMHGAILHVDNRKILLGMFPFGAMKLAREYIEHTAKYHRGGIAILDTKNGALAIHRHADEQATPAPFINVARQIANHAGLVDSAK